MSQLLTSWGQSIRASASESVLPMNFQGWSPLGLTGLISLLSKGRLKSLLQHHSLKVPIFWCSTFFWPNSYLYITIGKIIALTRQTVVGKVMSLLFNTLSRFVLAFLPRRKCLLISWLQSPSAVILEAKKIKVCYCFHSFPIYLPWSDGTRCHDLSFLNVKF